MCTLTNTQNLGNIDMEMSAKDIRKIKFIASEIPIERFFQRSEWSERHGERGL